MLSFLFYTYSAMKSIGGILAHNEIMTSEYLTDADYQGSFFFGRQ